jgi:hypothetical protein
VVDAELRRVLRPDRLGLERAAVGAGARPVAAKLVVESAHAAAAHAPAVLRLHGRGWRNHERHGLAVLLVRVVGVPVVVGGAVQRPHHGPARFGNPGREADNRQSSDNDPRTHGGASLQAGLNGQQLAHHISRFIDAPGMPT